jgi:hypothetical protein
MRKNLIGLLFLILTAIGQTVYSQDCKKCDTQILKEMSENMDKSDYKIIKNFLCTFDTTCYNNVEFSQWSNELLFKLIKIDVNLFNKALHDLGYKYVKLIGYELESPVVEVDLRETYLLIKNSKGPKDLIEELKKANNYRC